MSKETRKMRAMVQGGRRDRETKRNAREMRVWTEKETASHTCLE